LIYKGDAAVSTVIDGDTCEVMNNYSITPADEHQDELDDIERGITLVERIRLIEDGGNGARDETLI
jgi:hypothetical protein